MLETIGFVLIGLGCLLSLIGGIGIIRLPDMYARLHAVGITDTMASFLILCGLGFHATEYTDIAKLILVFMFLLFTSPASSYALANSAWRWGLHQDEKVHITVENESK